MAVAGTPGDRPVEEQPREQTGQQQQVRLRIDERNMKTSYANAFRTQGRPEEVLIDFGLETLVPSSQADKAEIMLQINERVILNYYTLKRLVLGLGQLISQYEEQFGKLELDAARRRRKDAN